jgi:hypothetical protein
MVLEYRLPNGAFGRVRHALGARKTHVLLLLPEGAVL